METGTLITFEKVLDVQSRDLQGHETNVKVGFGNTEWASAF